MHDIETYNETLFENIKHIDEYGNEYWEARELQKALEYGQWRRFNEVIEKAKNACLNSHNNFLTILPTLAKWLKQEIPQDV